MSKFCTSCGAQLADDAGFCTTCGAQQGGNAQQNNGAQQGGNFQNAAGNFASAAGNFANAAGQSVKQTFDGVTFDSVKGAMSIDNIKNVGQTKNKNTIIGLCAIAAAIIVVIILACVLITPGYEKPIANYFKAKQKGDGKLYAKTQADAYNEYIEDEWLDDSDFDTLEEYYEDQIEDSMEYYEDEFGDDVKFKYKVKKKKELKKSDLNDLEDNYEDWYDTKVDVTKGYKVKIELTIKGDEDDDTDSGWVYVYKIDGKWCFGGLGF